MRARLAALLLSLSAACSPGSPSPASAPSRSAPPSEPQKLLARLSIEFPKDARRTGIEVLNRFGVMEINVPSALICYSVSLRGVEAMHIYGVGSEASARGVVATLDSESEPFESARCIGGHDRAILTDVIANPDFYVFDAHHNDTKPDLRGTLTVMDRSSP